MIKVNELRIGNLIDSNGSIVEVESIDKYHGIETTANYEGSCNGKISCVSITKEWLIRFGFEKESETKYSIRAEDAIIGVYIENGRFYLIENGIYVGRPFSYLHTLQNGFYWLTGKELTIKE